MQLFIKWPVLGMGKIRSSGSRTHLLAGTRDRLPG